MKKEVFAVSGMKCVHCKATVEKALTSLVGVHNAEVNLTNANVTVEYDDNEVSTSQLKEAVDNSGRFEMTL